MFRRTINSILGFGVGLLLAISISTVAYGYDDMVTAWNGEMVTQPLPMPNEPDDSYVLVRARGTADIDYMELDEDYVPTGNIKTKEAVFVMQGSGTVVLDGYIITASHVVDPDLLWVSVGQKRVASGYPKKVNTRFIMLLDKRSDPVTVGWIHYMDRTRDLAIIKYVPNDTFKPISIDFGRAKNLEVGDLLAFVQHDRVPIAGCDDTRQDMSANEVTIRYGVVRITDWQGWREDSFAADIAGRGGDSGSLVYAFDNGKPVIVGVLYGGSWGMTTMAYIDTLIPILYPTDG